MGNTDSYLARDRAFVRYPKIEAELEEIIHAMSL